MVLTPTSKKLLREAIWRPIERRYQLRPTTAATHRTIASLVSKGLVEWWHPGAVYLLTTMGEANRRKEIAQLTRASEQRTVRA